MDMSMLFDVAVPRVGGSASSRSIAITLKPTMQAAVGQYRVRPVRSPTAPNNPPGATVLFSDVAGSPPVHDYEFFFFLAPDCNTNGNADPLDIATGFSADCNGNRVPDSCDLVLAPSLDCDGNGEIDSCQISRTRDPNTGISPLDLDNDGFIDYSPSRPGCGGPHPCPADFNADGEVNGNDISDYLNAWYSGIVNGTLAGDFNNDGETNGNDISDYINAWYGAVVCGGSCC